MNLKGVFILLIVLSLIVLFFFAPYIVFQNQSALEYRDNQIIDHWKDENTDFRIILLALFYPILLILESTFWSTRKVIWKRILLLLQSILVFSGGFFIWFVMSFHLFTGPYEYQLVFYLIIIYLSIGIAWNLLLAIPFFDKNKKISNSFKALSLQKKNEPITSND
ncbi:MAG: hypothetical protein KUG68_11785 [Flavobacteriaceae bacterium]|nr:hypothetical protein [Flavobacteriaceae bacterium]